MPEHREPMSEVQQVQQNEQLAAATLEIGRVLKDRQLAEALAEALCEREAEVSFLVVYNQ